jgi:hypothetical protein
MTCFDPQAGAAEQGGRAGGCAGRRQQEAQDTRAAARTGHTQKQVFSSVGDPDPQDTHVFRTPCPGPLVRGTEPDPEPDLSLFLINVLGRLK